MDEIKSLISQYTEWLQSKTVLRQVDDWVEITTPYLDRHNDYLQIYAQKQNGSFILTDDGYIINDLHQSGCTLDTPKRKSLLLMTSNGFGVKLDGSRLEVKATKEDFSYRKHNLLQAMLAVNDLFYLASPLVSSLFYEDVVAWLDDIKVRYVEQVKFQARAVMIIFSISSYPNQKSNLRGSSR